MRFFIVTLIHILATNTYAQRYSDDPPVKDEVKSLLSTNNEINGFGNVDFRVGNVNDKEALLIGAYGGVVINRTIMLGIAAYGLSSDLTFDGTLPSSGTARELNLYGGYAGIVMGVMVASKEVVHLSIPVIIGAGNLDVSDDNFFSSFSGSDAKFTVESSKFFVIEPGALLELNVSKTFRLGLGAGYRFATGTDLINVQDSDLSGLTGIVSFKFGVF